MGQRFGWSSVAPPTGSLRQKEVEKKELIMTEETTVYLQHMPRERESELWSLYVCDSQSNQECQLESNQPSSIHNTVKHCRANR